MSFNHTLSAVLRGRWLINREWAESYLPMVVNLIKGQSTNTINRTGNEGVELPFVIDPATMARYELFAYDPRAGRVSNPNIPENSVGVVPISGPVTKYNGECGEPGAIQRNNWLLEFERRSNVGSVILLMDTPGGEARAANSIIPTITNYSKPILSYVDDFNASLGMWLTSATDEVYISSKLGQMGSIGSYVMFLDFRGYFEKEGVKLHEIYAPQSVDKNKDYRDALQGNYDLIKKDLEIHVDDFISFVKQRRGDKAVANVNEWNTGKMFYAEDAIKFGLADGIRPFNQVVSKAAWLAKRKKK